MENYIFVCSHCGSRNCLDDVHTQINKSKTYAVEKESENTKLRAKISVCEQQIKDFTTELSAAREANLEMCVDYEDRLTKIQEEYNRLVQELETTMQELDSRAKVSKDELIQKEAELAQTRERCDILEQHVENLKQLTLKNQELQEDYNKISADRDQLEQKFNETTTRLEEEKSCVSKLEKTLGERSQEKERELAEKRQFCEKLETSVSELTEKLSADRVEYIKLKELFSSLSARHEELSGTFDALAKEHDLLQKKYIDLETELVKATGDHSGDKLSKKDQINLEKFKAVTEARIKKDYEEKLAKEKSNFSQRLTELQANLSTRLSITDIKKK